MYTHQHQNDDRYHNIIHREACCRSPHYKPHTYIHTMKCLAVIGSIYEIKLLNSLPRISLPQRLCKYKKIRKCPHLILLCFFLFCFSRDYFIHEFLGTSKWYEIYLFVGRFLDSTWGFKKTFQHEYRYIYVYVFHIYVYIGTVVKFCTLLYFEKLA